MSEQTPILTIQNLKISFPGKPPFVAVQDLSLQLREGKTIAVVGESGSGKSLTALSLMGLLPKGATATGRIILREKNLETDLLSLSKEGWQQIRGEKIGMVFQEPMSALNPIMKIGKQLAESISAHQSLSKRALKAATIEWLRKVQLPTPEQLYDRYPHQLSGGQKQRVMIAMAMCLHPKILIADEPTTALDVTVQKEVLQLMRSLQADFGTAMIFITHDLALAAAMADEVLVLYKGNIMEYGPAKELLGNPQDNYTKALLACRPGAVQKGTRLPVVDDFLKGGSIEMETPPIVVHPLNHDTLLKVNKLNIWFGTEENLWGKPRAFYKAVKEVSFELKRGEVLGLAGESGCGKSTLGRSLMGLLPIQSGKIIFDGLDLAHLDKKEWKGVRKNIQMIFQDPYSSLNPRMTIGDLLTEPMKVHSIVANDALRKEAERLLQIVQLPASSLHKYPHEFSGGQRQRIGIARALSLRPQLLICDESVSALDVSVQAQILNLLKDLQEEFSLSYLFISHDLNVVHYLADRVMVMQAGTIVETGTATQILKHPNHPYTQKLVASVL